MFLMEKISEASKDSLHADVSRYKSAGYRFVTASCLEDSENANGGFILYYHFDKDLNKEHIKVKLNKDDEVESISNIFWCAFLIENEIQEHFGVKFNNKAIDFAGRLVLAEDAPKAPLLKANDFKVNKS